MYKNLFIRFEVTNFCNLKCPHCARIDLEKHYKLNSTHISLECTKKWFPITFLLEKSPIFLFSGLIGEPTINPDFLKIIEYLSKFCQVRIDSNGSTNNEDWWKRLGSYNVQCTFSPDSLVPNNNQYRINSNTEKVISNIKAFIAGGGTAAWKYIPFMHNENELELQQQYAKDIGANFWIVQPGKFDPNKEGTMKPSKHFPNSKNYIESYTENKSPNYYCKLLGKVGSIIEVSPDGIIYPCCYTGRYFFMTYSNFFSTGDTKPQIYENMLSIDRYNCFVNDIISLIENQGGIKSLSLYHNTFENILESDFFKFSLEKSWETGNEYCKNYCGSRNYVISKT
jgi:hypothetical protein